MVANLSLDFAIRIVNLYKFLCTQKKEYVLSNQVLRSGTSIGANLAESEMSQSSADFIAKLHIALKEANETKYWLTLLQKTNYITKEQFDSINKDLRVIIGLLVNGLKKIKDREELIKLGMIEKPEEISKYYFHGSGHYIGLYTHDVGNDNELLEEDMVFTLEPGLYFDDLNLGIRIEDTLVVTKDGCEVMSDGIPKTVEEIEAFMAR